MNRGFAVSGIVGIVAVIIVLAGGSYVYVSQRDDVEEPIACTADAKLCPDGSAVGRTGPNCEFAPCPAGNSETEETEKDDDAWGTITITSPVENEEIIFPVTVAGSLLGHEWSTFEGEAGTVTIFDANDKAVSNSDIICLGTDWLDKSLAREPIDFEVQVGDREMISYLETDTGYLFFSGNGAKDGEIVSTHTLPVQFKKSAVVSEPEPELPIVIEEPPQNPDIPTLSYDGRVGGCGNIFVYRINENETEGISVSADVDVLDLSTESKTFDVLQDGLTVEVLKGTDIRWLYCDDTYDGQEQPTSWKATSGSVTIQLSSDDFREMPEFERWYEATVTVNDVVFSNGSTEAALETLSFENIGAGWLAG